MVGREQELAAGRRFLNRVGQGSGCLVFEGEAGIGKTTVWRETVALAEQLGHLVLACRPVLAEAKLSYSGLADLLAGLEANIVERLPVPQRRALEVALLQAAPGPRAPEPRALFTAFSSVLGLLAEARPVVVAIDDLQWLDRPSQAAVEFAVRRLRPGQSIGVIASQRVGEGAGVPPGLARALEDAQAERLLLGPLSVAALHLLFHERLGRSLPRPVVVRIATAARGNPFFALEIAREVVLRGDPAPGEALPVPGDLIELVSARIDRLPRATRAALLAAAALRDPTVELLDRAALEKAELAGLVQIVGRKVSFAHPLFAAAVYGSAPAIRRRRLHQRLAGALRDPEERARHLALAADGPSEEIARALELAAEQARSRGAPEGAAELLELAVRLTPPDRAEALCWRTVAAAEHYFHAGDLTRARALAEQVLAGSPSGPDRGNALRVLGEIRYHLDSFADAIPLFEKALVDLGDDPRSVDVRVNLTFAHIGHGSLKAAADHARKAVEDARSTGDEGLYAMALGASAIADFFLGGPIDRGRLELALALEDPDRQIAMSVRPSLVTAIILSMSDEFDRAAELLASLRRRTLERGEESDLPMVCAQFSHVERKRGNLTQALKYAEEGYEISGTLGSHTARALMLAERCFVLATMGDEEGARADAREAERLLSQVEYRLAYLWGRWALVFLEMSLGNAHVASELLEPMVAAVEMRHHFYPQAVLTLPDTLEALVAVGQLERAQALADLLEDYGSSHDFASAQAAASRCRALLLAARGDLDGAQAAADRAVAGYDRARMPLELGRALLVKGQLERRARRKLAARESLDRALELFDGVGARLWSDRARAELARTGLRQLGAGELTPSEMRVAELISQGMTVKRIAETVFVSPKTVEANLTRIYSKLGIHTRAELGRLMAERERPVASLAPPSSR